MSMTAQKKSLIKSRFQFVCRKTCLSFGVEEIGIIEDNFQVN